MKRQALAIVLVPAAAVAASSRAVRVEIEAPGACADEGRFVARLRARAPGLTVATDAGRVVRVRTAARDHRVEGEVTLVEGGREARRHVTGDSCAEVVDALALIAALALDHATPPSTNETEPSPPAATERATIAGDAGADAAPAATPPPPATPPSEVRPPVRGAAPPVSGTAAPAHDSSRSWRASIGAHAGLTAGVAPDPILSAPVFLEVARALRGDGARVAPAIRMRFERSGSGAVTVPGGGAHFTWTTGSVELCPLTWSRGQLELRPCARLEAGVLAGAGLAVTPERSEARPWVSGGAVGRARLGIAGPLFLELEGGALFPFTRDRFFVEPDVTIHRAPVAAWAAAGGAGVTFW
jgi:hypothetical protein